MAKSQVKIQQTAGRDALRTRTQEEEHTHHHQNREEEGVVVQDGKVNDDALLHGRQVRHVVLNILSSGRAFHGYRSLVFLEQHDEVTIRHRYDREDHRGPIQLFVILHGEPEEGDDEEDLDELPHQHGRCPRFYRLHATWQDKPKNQQ